MISPMTLGRAYSFAIWLLPSQISSLLLISHRTGVTAEIFRKVQSEWKLLVTDAAAPTIP